MLAYILWHLYQIFDGTSKLCRLLVWMSRDWSFLYRYGSWIFCVRDGIDLKVVVAVLVQIY